MFYGLEDSAFRGLLFLQSFMAALRNAIRKQIEKEIRALFPHLSVLYIEKIDDANLLVIGGQSILNNKQKVTGVIT